MQKIKKVLCLLLSALMILSMGIPAFAVDKTTANNSVNETQKTATTADTQNSPLMIEISTDKEKYKALGIAQITATVTNTSNEDIQNVSAEAVFTDLAPVGSSSDIKKEVETLKAGESISFTYKATLNKSEHKLNIFQKFFLWLVRLFNGGFTAKDNGFDNGRECTEQTNAIIFGKFEADNIIKVWYGDNGENPGRPDNPVTQDKTYEELIKDVDIDEVYDYDDCDISIEKETGTEYINNIITIMFEDECSNEKKAEIINSINGTVVGGSTTHNELYIQVSKTESKKMEGLCDELEKNKLVYLATYDRMTTSKNDVIPDDPWGILDDVPSENWNDIFYAGNQNWNAIAVEAPGAWQYNDYFSTINIGIVDTGFSTSNPDLNLQVISKVNTPENHGTHVAGIIGATANNKKGITGVVWKKIFTHMMPRNPLTNRQK